MRKPIIAGNWKMNMTPSEGVKLVEELKLVLSDVTHCDVVVCPTFVALPAVKEALQGSNIKLGAQNMHYEEKGAFTGEVAPAMLKEVGVEYVIIGHSERREYYGETDETVNKKLKAAHAHGLIPIMCCGETLAQREAGETNAWVSGQIKAGLDGLTDGQLEGTVVAYEPIWAIGTGVTASKEQAEETVSVIRDAIRENFGNVADKMRIQYGGSMNAKNAAELMAMPNIDGGLIGGASLKATDFSQVVHFNA